MKVLLNQAEISEAVCAYISQQGIGLDGKTVAVTFTQTRSEEGLVASVAVENAPQLPDLSSDVGAERTRPVLAVVSGSTPAAAPPATSPFVGEVQDSGPGETPATGTDGTDVAPPAGKKTSLFGN
jgi:hypothetical protein